MLFFFNYHEEKIKDDAPRCFTFNVRISHYIYITYVTSSYYIYIIYDIYIYIYISNLPDILTHDTEKIVRVGNSQKFLRLKGDKRISGVDGKEGEDSKKKCKRCKQTCDDETNESTECNLWNITFVVLSRNLRQRYVGNSCDCPLGTFKECPSS